MCALNYGAKSELLTSGTLNSVSLSFSKSALRARGHEREQQQNMRGGVIRRENPLYYLSEMEELFKQGHADSVAKKLTEGLGRPIQISAVSCALAFKEWEDKRSQEHLDLLLAP